MKRILCLLLLSACLTDVQGARHTLESSGFKDIVLTGYEYFGCGESDFSSTGFQATNPLGQRVAGVVCCGITKGCTVRF